MHAVINYANKRGEWKWNYYFIPWHYSDINGIMSALVRPADDMYKTYSVTDFHSKYHLDSIIFLTKANYPTWSGLMNISQTRKAWNIWLDLQTNAYACFRLLVVISKGWALMVWSDGLTFVQKVTAVSLSKHQ